MPGGVGERCQTSPRCAYLRGFLKCERDVCLGQSKLPLSVDKN
jgi:hypothetical protein